MNVPDGDHLHALVEAGKAFPELLKSIGTSLSDIYKIALGDRLSAYRLQRAEQLRRDTERKFEERGLTGRAEVSPSICLPLLEAACDESRPVLQDLWAELLTTALDPARSRLVRAIIVETVKKFEPLDVLVLKAVYDGGINGPAATPARLSDIVCAGEDETQVCIDNLVTLKCVIKNTNNVDIFTTALGRELIRAASPG